MDVQEWCIDEEEQALIYEFWIVEFSLALEGDPKNVDKILGKAFKEAARSQVLFLYERLAEWRRYQFVEWAGRV